MTGENPLTNPNGHPDKVNVPKNKEERSFVTIDLDYIGSPVSFWKILKDMQKESHNNGVTFNCGKIITITHEE